MRKCARKSFTKLSRIENRELSVAIKDARGRRLMKKSERWKRMEVGEEA